MSRNRFSFISLGDLLKIFGGVIAGVFFVTSPLKDAVLVKIYGEEVTANFIGESVHDSDRGFTPKIVIRPSSSYGITGGILTWNASVGGIQRESFTQEFEPFKFERVFEYPATEKSEFGDDTVVKYSVRMRTKFSERNIGSIEYLYERNPNRGFVGVKNFTGYWVVHFLDLNAIGKLELVEKFDRTLDANFYLPSEISDEHKVVLTGVRDGEVVRFSSNNKDSGFSFNGKYGFNKDEKNATIKGFLTHCSPCDGETRKEVSNSEIWMFAPYFD